MILLKITDKILLQKIFQIKTLSNTLLECVYNDSTLCRKLQRSFRLSSSEEKKKKKEKKSYGIEVERVFTRDYEHIVNVNVEKSL